MARSAPVVVATPWDALLLQGTGHTARTEDILSPGRGSRAVHTGEACLVIAGQRCTCAADVYAAHGFARPRDGADPQPLPGSRLARDLAELGTMGMSELDGALKLLQADLARWTKLYMAARYQRRREDPDEMARRAAWEAEHREQRLAYKKAYREANRERIAAQEQAWLERARLADPEGLRARAREATRRWAEANKAALTAKARERARRLAALARGETGTPEEQQAARDTIARRRVAERERHAARMADPAYAERERQRQAERYERDQEALKAKDRERSARRRAEVEAMKAAAKAIGQAGLQDRIEQRAAEATAQTAPSGWHARREALLQQMGATVGGEESTSCA